MTAPISAPPGQPTSAYKPVNPKIEEQQAKKPAKKGGNKLLVVGIIVCILAVAALVCAVIFVMNQPAGNGSTQQEALNAPSNSQITKALEDADLKAPDISSFKYVSTDDLTGPTFQDIETAQGNSSNVCNVTANAMFKNASVMIQQPVAVRFTQKDNDWVAGSVTTSPADITPASGPDMEALTKDMPELLKKYDENLAAQFTDSDIVADSKGLTAQGGTVKFTLEKNENGTVKKCDADVKVSWKNDSGWDAQIDSVSDVTTTSNNQNSEEPAGGNDDPGQPDALLQCTSGDLVQIPGIIDYVNDRFLLRADNYIRVEMDGKVFNVHYFELQSNTMQFTVGSHVEITGVISETGALRQAPLVITLN